jgi:hypothetical protein
MMRLYAKRWWAASTCKILAGIPRVDRIACAAVARRFHLWHRGRMSIERWGAAFQRLVDALNQPSEAAALSAAVADDIRIDRHAPGERGIAPVVEAFDGLAEVARWFARMPAGVTFSLAGAVWPDGADGDGGAGGGACGVQYAIVVGEFHNGGIWIARLAGDGRIAFLSHHPYALRT